MSLYRNSGHRSVNHIQESKNRKRMPGWMLAVIDILLAGVFLCVFSIYNYVLPRHFDNEEIVVASIESWEVNTFELPNINDDGEVASDNETDSGDESEAEVIVDSEGGERGSAKSDNLGDITNYGNSDTLDISADNNESADIRNENKTVTQVNSYHSDNIELTTNQVEIGSGSKKITYFVSDIYVANVKYLKTAFATGAYGKNLRESTKQMAEDNDSILAINGDFYGNSEIGVVIRNGVLYRSKVYDADICVLFMDGIMKTYSPDEFDENEVLAQGAWQAWIFGPQLLDGNGNILSTFNSTYYLSKAHPRTAIGYVEPGHYVFVVVDGRDEGYSRGVTLSELAQIMVDEGCVAAYNLDGGKSAAMVYEEEYVNQPSDGGRTISDIIYIGE